MGLYDLFIFALNLMAKMKAISFLIIIMMVFSCDKENENICPKITEYQIDWVNENKIQFSWVEPPALSTSYEYGPKGFQLGNGTKFIFGTIGGTDEYNEKEVEISVNIEPGKTYDLYFQLNCISNTSSEFTGPLQFSTLNYGEGCSKPNSLHASSITNTSVVLDWSSINAGSWGIQFFDVSTNDNQIFYTSNNPYLLQGLAPNTNYNISVFSICETITSTNSDSITIQTLE